MIYLDHNATTPIAPAVREAMLPTLDGLFGNPSSIHEAGRLARNAIDQARRDVASFVNVHARQVIFTGSGTEAHNLALKGVALRRGKGRILISAIEHSSIRGAARDLAGLGFGVEEIPVTGTGVVEPAEVRRRLADDVILVSVMTANNETGVLQDIAAIARDVRAAGAVMHTDAVQAAGKCALDFSALGVQLLSLSAHKLYGPKGVGALVTDGSVDLSAQVSGGGQEAGLRAGTENVPGIVGFGAACALAGQSLDARSERSRELRDRFEQRLREKFDATVFGNTAPRLGNTSQFALADMDGETLQMGLDRHGIAVSTGSACHSKSTEASHVLLAMGVPVETARGAIRASFGAGNTQADVDALLAALADVRRVLPTGAVGW